MVHAGPNTRSEIAAALLRYVARSPRSTQILAPSGETLAVNAAWEQLWGTGLADLAEYNIRRDPQLRAKGLADLLERAFAGEAVELPTIAYQLAFGPSVGQTRWVRASATPVFDDDAGLTYVVLVHEDMTEAIVATEALNQTRELLEEAQRTAGIGSWSWDLTSNQLTWSSETYALIGIDPGTAVTFDRYLDAVHPDDRERLAAEVGRALHERGAFESYHRIVLPDGGVRTLHARGRVVLGPDGAALRMVGSGQDVSERLEAERADRAARDALLARERAAREEAEATAAALSVLNGVGQVVAAELDLEKLVQSVTDAATELTGARFGAFFYNVTDSAGESYTLYTLSGAPIDAFAGFPMPRATAIFGPTFRGEGVVRLADVRRDPRYGQNAPNAGPPPGHLPVVSYLAVPVISRSGEVLGGLFFGHPEPGVFDRRSEELVTGLAAYAAVAIDNARLFRTAQGSERRYRGLFEGVADGILVADRNRRYRDANAAALELLGYSRAELLSRAIDDVVASGPDWTRAEYGRYLADGHWRGELELVRKDGTQVPVDASATVIELPDGPVYLAVVRDATERRTAQHQQQRFLEAVSHDLKNPLAVILANAQVLRRRVRRGRDLDPDWLDQTAAAVESAARQMRHQLGEFQDVVYLRSGNPLELRTAPTDLVALVKEATAALRTTSAAHTIRVEGAAELVGIWDPIRLRRVFDNLLSNAVKYSPDGGGITVTVCRVVDGDRNQAVVTVRDEGIGIPADDLTHIFERYRRGSNVARATAGTGIGLSGAAQIVEQHGGTIRVESTEGHGTTVTVTLPLDPDHP